MARLHLDRIDAQSRIIDALTGRIEEAQTPARTTSPGSTDQSQKQRWAVRVGSPDP